MQQKGEVVRSAVGSDQVRQAVLIKIDHHDRSWVRTGGKPLWGLEGAIAVSERNRHIAGTAIGREKVWHGISIDISDSDSPQLGTKPLAHLHVAAGLKRPIPAA